MISRVTLKKTDGTYVELIFGMHANKCHAKLRQYLTDRDKINLPNGIDISKKENFEKLTGSQLTDLEILNYNLVTSVIGAGMECKRRYDRDFSEKSEEEILALAEILIDELGGVGSEETLKALSAFKYLSNAGETKAETIPQKKTSRGKK